MLSRRSNAVAGFDADIGGVNAMIVDV
jgi:delta 1-pyrroline-5-carboxylate dehydrogenase